MVSEDNKESSETSSMSKQEDPVAVQIRRDLTLAVMGLLVVIALVAAFQIGAMPVLDKLLPLVAIIFGFFFGHRTGKS